MNNFITDLFKFDYSQPVDIIIIIIIIISVSAVILYLFIKYILKRKPSYHTKDYWDSRYSIYSTDMDWYCNFNKLSTDFRVEEILKERFPKKRNIHILELGCGNSSMAIDLHNLGYKNISSIDFSSVIINKMKMKYMNEDIKCINSQINNSYLR
jgi:hypothetical protein